MVHVKDLKRKQIALLISGLTMNTVFSVAMAADASDQQETAPNLINVTSAEEIRKLPDVNAGEAVRRLPGISLETDTGEGRYVNIRGLDADLTSTTFGRRDVD
jgi:outer membrane receptor for ferrienterochelin and colicin